MFAPKIEITNKMLWSVAQIEAAHEAVENSRLSPEWEMRFREDALIRTVAAVMKLDGAMVSRIEVEKIIKVEASRDERAEEVALRAGVVAKEKEIQEILNRQSAYKYAEQLVRLTGKTGLTAYGEKELLQIQALLLEKIQPSHLLGVYRTAGVEEGDFLSQLIESPPLSVEVPYQLEDFWRWFKGTAKGEIYPAIKAGVVLVELARILPFATGNAGAILIFVQLVLGIEGRGFKRMLAFEETLRERSGEFGRLLAAPLSGAPEGLTDFLEFWTGVIALEAENLKLKMRRLEGERTPVRWGQQVALSERQIALMEAFQVRGELMMNEARAVLPAVSDDTVLRDLAGLINKKLIRKKGKTKGAKYFLYK